MRLTIEGKVKESNSLQQLKMFCYYRLTDPLLGEEILGNWTSDISYSIV